MAAIARRLLSYLAEISETIKARRPKTLEEAHAMLDLFEVMAGEAVREEGPKIAACYDR